MNTEVEPQQRNQISPDDRTMALLAHILGIVSSFLGPLIIWLINKDNPQKGFVAGQAKEALNFQITVIIASLVCAVLMLVFIGFFLMMALWALMIAFPIIAAAKANTGEWYRYPMILRLVR